MNNDRMQYLLDRIDQVSLAELVKLPPAQADLVLRDIADARQELLAEVAQQIIRQRSQ